MSSYLQSCLSHLRQSGICSSTENAGVALNLPREYPIILLVASGMFYIQQRAQHYMMKRQRSVMGRSPSFMAVYRKSHEIAFGPDFYDLQHDGGLPEQGHGYGWYTANRLSYGEWYRQSCARLAYDEVQEATPLRVFQLLVGGLQFPLVAIGSGVLYILAATRRVKNLYLDNGVQVAKLAFSTRIKVFSEKVLSWLALGAIGIIIFESYGGK